MNVTGRPSPDLDGIVSDGEFILFDPALIDTNQPPTENGHFIRSDVVVSLEDGR